MWKSLHCELFQRGASGEAMIGGVNRAAGPFVCANERWVRLPPPRRSPRSKEGTRFCEDRWRRFESSRWHVSGPVCFPSFIPSPAQAGPTSDGYWQQLGSTPTPDPMPPFQGRDTSLRSSSVEVRILSVAPRFFTSPSGRYLVSKSGFAVFDSRAACACVSSRSSAWQSTRFGSETSEVRILSARRSFFARVV